jgi:shikimate kinase
MGCGKSTAGKKAADIARVPFIDVDHEIEHKEGMSVSDIFDRRGEQAFRLLESQVLFDLSAQRGAIVSTGGGIILAQKNVDRMKKTGKIVWIRRPIKSILAGINASARPLIQDDPEKLIRIYVQREPLYEKYADAVVDNETSLEDAARAIAKLYAE